ncbi:MAG: ATP-binding protein, partial [Deltaproteobacteria bacterium]|nr:ATP-binding protein [Deltaproteobacteria bacterium]
VRLDKAVYVDKTEYLPMVRKAGRFVFCARPRRFGKSLTVSALDAFWSGRADLFQGLAAEEVVTSQNFITRPVIRLDMSTPADSDTNTLLEEKIMGRLGVNAERHKVSLRGADSADAFQFLIEDIHKASGKHVVILIDEYDAPVISIIQREEPEDDRRLLKQTRIVMRRLYGQIKAADEHIESVFITGVTKFSRMGLFSLLNNLIDISLEPKFGAFMGYTQDELEQNFKDFITETANELRMSDKGILRKIRDHYDGFSFDGKIRLYNPFSILSFFHFREFDNFWMESGSNTLIRNFLKEKELSADQFQNMAVNRFFVRDPGEIDSTPPEGFLYQAGYLTLRSKGKSKYVLDYPNREVRLAISTLFLESLTQNSVWNSISDLGRDLKRPLATGDVPGMVNVFTRLLAAVTYDDHAAAGRGHRDGAKGNDIGESAGTDPPDVRDTEPTDGPPDNPRATRGESFYRSVLHAAIWMAGAIVAAEKHENVGRTDIEAVYGRFQYVMELKMSEDVLGADDAVRAGMLQIREKGYGRSYRNPFLVSLAVGRKERNVVACLFKRGESAVEIRLPGKP